MFSLLAVILVLAVVFSLAARGLWECLGARKARITSGKIFTIELNKMLDELADGC
jgi:hypothetical protein